MTLDQVLDDAWARLARGVKDRRSPFHTPVVATGAATVRQRVMVLRAADRARGVLRFHTDARSAKAGMLGNGVSVLAYDPVARVQVSFTGGGRIVTGADADAFWTQTTLSGRRCYLADPGPGTAIATPRSGLPESLTGRVPTWTESEAGRVNFAALLVTVEAVEWLELDAHGNRRARFERRAAAWDGTWLIP